MATASFLRARCVALIALGLLPSCVDYGARQESPVITSVCEAGSPSDPPHAYSGRNVSIESAITELQTGVFLVDNRCPNPFTFVRIMYPATPDDSVTALQ